jgi:hypothetical protein
MTYQERCELADLKNLTLDGKPARLVGLRLDFPHIVTNDGIDIEFCWPTAKRIITEKNGCFRS